MLNVYSVHVKCRVPGFPGSRSPEAFDGHDLSAGVHSLFAIGSEIEPVPFHLAAIAAAAIC